jgi:hypothetical protein
MKQTVDIRPSYSQVVICDPTAKVEVPLWRKGVPLVASETCILCGCYPDSDGPTELTFGTGKEVFVDSRPLFEGTLKTPGRTIALETVEGDSILSMPTDGTETLIRIWANHDWCPDKVIIGID